MISLDRIASCTKGLCASLALTTIIVSCAKEEDYAHPPKIYFASEGSYEIALTDTITLQPRIIYDDNSKYEWIVDNDVVSSELNYEFIPKSRKDYSLTFRVSNSQGSDTFGISICVVQKADFDSFDNFSVPTKNKLVMCASGETSDFICDGIVFSNGIAPDTSDWTGFAFSNVINEQSSVVQSALGVAYIPGTATSNNYMAVNASAGAEVFFGQKFKPTSIDIANDNLVYLFSKFGYSVGDTVITKAASYADRFTVVFSALDANGAPTGAEVRSDLIECTFDNPAKFIRRTDWLTVDLTGLGDAYGILMEVETTSNGWPKRFCIDNLRLQD